MKWNSFDTRWMLSLFGTAVGAGILYLPIRAGGGGFYPVVAMCFIIFPMVYLSHRALSRFVCQANGDDKDITHAAEEYFGRGVSIFISILYFFAIFPICLAYCVGITNTFESFIYNQILPLVNDHHPRVAPLGTLAGFIQSIYYDPHSYYIPFDFLQQSESIFVKLESENYANLLPFWRAALVFILVSAFMLIMLFSEKLITKVCQWLVYPLCAILFIFSLYLIPQWNLESLSAVPDTKEFLTIVWLTLPVLVFSFNHSPAISTFALSVKREYGANAIAKSDSILLRTSVMLLVFVMFFVFSCVLSLSPAELAEARAQNIPVIAAILFLMPIIAIYTISKMKQFQNPALDAFVFITGLLTIFTVVYKLIG